MRALQTFVVTALPPPPSPAPASSLPHIAKEGKYVLKCRPQTMAINCNSTKFAVIDMNSVLYLYYPPAPPPHPPTPHIPPL